MDKAEVVFSLAVVHPAIAQQQPLIFYPRLYRCKDRLSCVCDCCDTHLDATLSQRSIQSHTPCHQSDVWVHPPQNKRGLNKLGFMRRSTRYVNGDRKARAVCNCHDLAPFATLGFADGGAPFLAGTNVPSIKHSAKSIWPRVYKSSARTFRIWTNTDPGLEVSVTGRAGWISTRDVSPSRASAHDPQNAVHHLARVATWPTSAVSTTRRDRDKRFD